MKRPLEPSWVRSVAPEIIWPALPSQAATQLLAQLYQLEQSQWWPEAQLRAAQLRQFLPLVRHAAENSAFYRQRLAAEHVDLTAAVAWETLQRLPVLQKS